MRKIAAAALALALSPAAPLPARADLPEDSCFVQLEAGAGTATAVRRLAFRVQPLTGNDRELNLPYRYAMLAVVLGPGAPGDGVSGKRLTQSLVCRNDTGICTAAERQAELTFRLQGDDRLTLVTDDMPVADYGESDLAGNLAYPPGTPVRLDLVRAGPEDCRNF